MLRGLHQGLAERRGGGLRRQPGWHLLQGGLVQRHLLPDRPLLHRRPGELHAGSCGLLRDGGDCGTGHIRLLTRQVQPQRRLHEQRRLQRQLQRRLVESCRVDERGRVRQLRARLLQLGGRGVPSVCAARMGPRWLGSVLSGPHFAAFVGAFSTAY